MSTEFDLETLKAGIVNDNRYERRLEQLTSDNKEVGRIKKVVEESVENINEGQLLSLFMVSHKAAKPR